MRYAVYFAKECFNWQDRYEMEDIANPEDLERTHVLLFSEFEAADLEELFYQMQAENWSPEGEAREPIRAFKLGHTSMSVGDIAVDLDSGRVWLCRPIGWADLSDGDRLAWQFK